jgi:pSer/pThr/pTyr-binding forkhead associated (FHA) protein
VVCVQCGVANEATAQVCRYCGAPQKPLSSSSPRYPAAGTAAAGQTSAAKATRNVVVSQPPPGGQRRSGEVPALGRSGDAYGALALGTTSSDPSPDQPAIDLNPQACLVVILRDGTDGGVYPLIQQRTDIGSREGEIVLKEDPYLSPRHARIERRGENFVLLDLASVNGIYLRLREPRALSDGDMILLGQQVLRFELPSEVERHVGAAMQHGVMIFGTPEQPRLARLIQYTTEGLARDVYYLHRSETVFGREAADLTFSDDPFLSRKHAAIVAHPHDGQFILRDLGSSNGTALRCRTEHTLVSGDQFRLGRHLFRFDSSSSGSDQREGQRLS